MPITLRLVAYNVLEGLKPIGRSEDERRLVDRERAAVVRRVVAELNPNILVLNEALYCRLHAGREVDYAGLFGFPHQAAALYDHAWGNAILSRYSIVESREMRIHNRGGLVVVIDTPLGQVTVASYHPHPGRFPENKAEDFANLISGTTGPLIVCGDFNCISPEDYVDREFLIKAFRSFSSDPVATVDRFLESGCQVFEKLAKFGLTDAVPPSGRRYSIPTDLLKTDKTSAMRIDHVLANDEVEVAAGEVVHSSASNQASDHHPVMIEFRLLRKCGGSR